jgi:HSP20 family protein
MSMFDEMLRLRQNFDRLTTGLPQERPGAAYPLVNLYDNGEAFLLRAEVPGVDKTALEITVKANQVTVRGQRDVRPAAEHSAYHRREREGGTFRRIVSLPERVDANAVQATYKNGLLEVTVPRAAEAKPRKIEIA